MVFYNAANIQIILRIFNEIIALILRTIAFLALALTVEWSSRQGEFHPKPLTEPYVTVYRHMALLIYAIN